MLARSSQAVTNIATLPGVVQSSIHVYPMELKALLKLFDHDPSPAHLERFETLLANPPVVTGREIITSALQAEVAAAAKKPAEMEAALLKTAKDVGDFYPKVILARAKLESGDIPGAQALVKEISVAARNSSEFIALQQELEAKVGKP